MREESRLLCPNCRMPLEKSIEELNLEARTTGTALCGACGAKFQLSDVEGGQLTMEPAVVGPASVPARQSGRNPFALVVVAIIATGMLYFGFSMSRRSGPTHPLGMAHGTPAPDFTLDSLDGQSMRLSDLRGKAVLLNFWATWCGPCKIEMPWFIELQKEYGPQGLQIVGVAMDDSSKEDIAKFAKEMGVNYPVLLGKEAVGDAYGGVPALPESFFIGRDGKIVDKIIGLKGRGEIEESIRKALDTQAGANSSAALAAPQAQN